MKKDRIIPLKPRKLIREKVVSKLNPNEVRSVYDHDDLNDLYVLKILEALKEVEKSDFSDRFEYADLLEAVFTLASYNKLSKYDLQLAMDQKRKEKGTFSNVVLTNLNPNNPSNELYFKVARGYIKTPTDPKVIENICMSYRHDFGLLPTFQKELIIHECKEWMRAMENTLNTFPHAGEGDYADNIRAEEGFRDNRNQFDNYRDEVSDELSNVKAQELDLERLKGQPVDTKTPLSTDKLEDKSFLSLCEQVAMEYESLDEGFYKDDHNNCVVKRLFPNNEEKQEVVRLSVEMSQVSDRLEVEIAADLKDADFSFLYLNLIWGFIKIKDTSMPDSEADYYALNLAVLHPDFDLTTAVRKTAELISKAQSGTPYAEGRIQHLQNTLNELKIPQKLAEKYEEQPKGTTDPKAHPAYVPKFDRQANPCIAGMVESGIRKTYTAEDKPKQFLEVVEDYKTVGADTADELDLKVQHYLDKGWKLKGGGFAVTSEMKVKGVASFPSLVPKFMQTIMKVKQDQVSDYLSSKAKERTFEKMDVMDLGGEAETTEGNAPHETLERESESRKSDIDTTEESENENGIDWNNTVVDIRFCINHEALSSMLKARTRNILMSSFQGIDITKVGITQFVNIKGAGFGTWDNLQAMVSYVKEMRGQSTPAHEDNSDSNKRVVTLAELHTYAAMGRIDVSVELWDTLLDIGTVDATDLEQIDKAKFLSIKGSATELLVELAKHIDFIRKNELQLKNPNQKHNWEFVRDNYPNLVSTRLIGMLAKHFKDVNDVTTITKEVYISKPKAGAGTWKELQFVIDKINELKTK